MKRLFSQKDRSCLSLTFMLGSFPIYFLLVFFNISLSSAQIISPSPSSSSIAKFSEVPVDLSTGIPQINIPLYTIRSAKLSYPITLSYHGSGIKVDDISSSVGTGFQILAGGEITRIMRVRPDEQPFGYFANAASVPDQTAAIPLATKQALVTRATDMTPDLFYYNTGVDAGKIVFDNLKVPRSIPNKPIKISTNTTTLATFVIAQSDGTNFEFEAGEASTANLQEINATVTYTSSWYLARIVSADKLDTIRFNYTLRPSYTYYTNDSRALLFFYNVPAGAYRNQFELTNVLRKVSVTVQGTRYLSSIEYKGGKSEFVFSSRADDLNEKKLDQIIFWNKDAVTGTLVEERRINFTYGYFSNVDTGTRLRLDSFQERFNATTYNPPYIFNYTHKILPAPGSFATDHWGYYNGALLNNNPIPAFTHPTGVIISTSNREVNSSYSGGCMLRAITSPLGGRTEYFFEPNQYYSGTANVVGPGLRISKIISNDVATGVSATTNYEYLIPGTANSSGKLMNNPLYTTHLQVVDDNHGSNLQYNCTYIQTNATDTGNFPGAPLIYEYVTNYQGNDLNVAGKTVSKFTTYTPPTQGYPYFPVNEDSWNSGDLDTQEFYKVVGGVSTLVKRVRNFYTVSPNFTTTKGLLAATSKIFFLTEPQLAGDFFLANYFAYSKFKYLSQTDVYDYEQNSGTLNLSNTQKFFYDRTNVHLFLTKTETTNSSGETWRKEFTYVPDYTGGVYTTMQSKNMIQFPVETTSTMQRGANEYITGYQKIEFFEWMTGKVYPKNFYNAKFTTNLLKSAFTAAPSSYVYLHSRINAYDAMGIAVENETIGDRPTALIVDKMQNRAIAEANVSAASQIAYSSFESNDFGNWTMNSGTGAGTRAVSVSLSGTFKSFATSTTQTINYTYTVTRTAGPSPALVFTKEGLAPIYKTLANASGTGSVSLVAGLWNVSLEYDFNVTAAGASFSYQYTYPLAPPIVTAQAKTGLRSIQFGATQKISKTLLPVGNYTVAYYQKGGTITLTPLGGAIVNSTATGTAGTDGWTKIVKQITIGSTAQSIEISGSGIYLDELRLYPSGSLMTTSCFNSFKQPTTQTDINLKSKFMEYDAWRRTKLIRDHDRNIVQHYAYKTLIN